MKLKTTVVSIISSGLLFTGIASANTHNIETDLIYGNGNVVTSQGEAFVAGSSVQNNLYTDLVYGGQKTLPTRGEAPERFVDNRDSNTDIIYGS